MSAVLTGDLALDLPLGGVQLIEASAGSGKTHTLAGVYARLIVECGLSAKQILVVTFTKAATEELKARLRERLTLCADVATRIAAGEVVNTEAEPVLEQCRALIARALERGEESATALRTRLRLAALELDTAQISTIHGFCQRSLREQGLDEGGSDTISPDRDLLETIAADLWREIATGADAQRYDAFVRVADSSESLLRLLLATCASDAGLSPQESGDPASAHAALDALRKATRAFVQSWLQQGEPAFAALLARARSGDLNKASYAAEKVEAHAAAFALALARGELPDRNLLQRYTPAALAKGLKKGKPPLPATEFFAAIEPLLAVHDAADRAQQRWGMGLLHEAVAEAHRRLDALRRAQRSASYDDLIRRLRDALDGAHGAALAEKLHAQYPFALVDEFQDTDARQFAIFDAIYGAPHPAIGSADSPPLSRFAGEGRMNCRARARGNLILIGDPKQAIYRFRGGDIQTYLRARQRADGTHSLTHNHRSRPAYLRALQQLYAFSAGRAFGSAPIRFERVQPGGRATDEDFLLGDAPAPALTFWRDDADAGGNVDDARARVADACAGAILDLLERGASGGARVRVKLDNGDVGYRELLPRDIAILVERHKDGLEMKRALDALRIPAVCVTNASVFAGEEAAELHTLLDALLEFGEARLRALLATNLFGRRLGDIVALQADPARWSRRLGEFAELRRIWFAHGVLALLERVFTERAADLLALTDGERRLTNWLQLADLAQEASAMASGERGLVDWLAQRIAAADDNNEAEQLRLESDADRVQIRTLHVSKGLEYPIVFLPFAAFRRVRQRRHPGAVSFHDDAGDAQLRWIVDSDEAKNDAAARAALARDDEEDIDERLRLLYVGLTRAQMACHVVLGDFGAQGQSAALLHMLGVDEGKSAPPASSLVERLAALTARDDNAITLADLPAATARRWQPAPAPQLGEAKRATRVVFETRGSHSFSRLHAGANGEKRIFDERAGREDEATPAFDAESPDVSLPTPLAGSRFGTAFHELIEVADFAAWRDWHGRAIPPGQDALIDRIVRRHALDADPERARRTLADLLARTLNGKLPLGARLADLAPGEYRAEMPFHFALAGVDTARWIALLRKHEYVADRSRFDTARLEGLMTGVLDLVVLHAGRWWVIDYKTNLLRPRGESAAYSRDAVDAAVRANEYDLQYLIYLVALHRWLKARDPAYDYERDIGGALYLFVRGLDGEGANGVHECKPARELVEAMDALFAPAKELA
ncbi:MAG: exodeoxyribonuclease V subunit beta [Proteobacteria bacterium]|uniref:exodeoxyribonuclease V subunit beta n=1 Tax=Rudaea sp. TaxID=2136325 RepID=UPI003220254F|nr:exodeoxyribonuclease V subunit beta [Pseudomonadota bacterium]